MSFAEDLKAASMARRCRLWGPEISYVKPHAILREVSTRGAGSGRLWSGVDPAWFRATDTVPADRIVSAVLKEADVEHRELLGPWRGRRLVRARMVLYYMLRQHTNLSLPAIGMRLGNRDHSTILNGIRRVSQRPWEFEPLMSNVSFRLGFGAPRELFIQ